MMSLIQKQYQNCRGFWFKLFSIEDNVFYEFLIFTHPKCLSEKCLDLTKQQFSINWT